MKCPWCGAPDVLFWCEVCFDGYVEQAPVEEALEDWA